MVEARAELVTADNPSVIPPMVAVGLLEEFFVMTTAGRLAARGDHGGWLGRSRQNTLARWLHFQTRGNDAFRG
jgi:hypothetical protein